jgi:glutamate formiminotransferase/formiminotetrahydrofolate cyclodeaminase
MAAFGLSNSTEEEKLVRKNAIQAATKVAIVTPFKVMQLANDSFEIIKAMAEEGNPNSVSDAGVAALCARSAVLGAFLNVKINCGSYIDKEFVSDILIKGQQIVDNAISQENEILKVVYHKIE